MARIAQVNLVDLDVVSGVGVATYKLKVLRTDATSPSSPVDDVDEFTFTVAVDSLDTMDDAMIAACLSVAAGTGLLKEEIIAKGRPRVQPRVIYGTGAAPSPTGLLDGAIYIQYTP